LLVELGGRVSLGRFDLGGLDNEELVAHPPVAVIVEAGDELQRAQKTIQKIRDGGPLMEVPILIAVTVARLPSLDFSIGFDDFVLMPIVLNVTVHWLNGILQSAFAWSLPGSITSNLELMVFGGLIIFFLIVEPHGLARLWQIGKEKLRLWPFPH